MERYLLYELQFLSCPHTGSINQMASHPWGELRLIEICFFSFLFFFSFLWVCHVIIFKYYTWESCTCFAQHVLLVEWKYICDNRSWKKFICVGFLIFIFINSILNALEVFWIKKRLLLFSYKANNGLCSAHLDSHPWGDTMKAGQMSYAYCMAGKEQRKVGFSPYIRERGSHFLFSSPKKDR